MFVSSGFFCCVGFFGLFFVCFFFKCLQCYKEISKLERNGRAQITRVQALKSKKSEALFTANKL